MSRRLELLKDLYQRRQARANLHDFIKYTKPSYEETWFNKLICEALTRIEKRILARDSARLLVRMPPRAGKSEIISRKFPAWFMGRNPTMDVILISYAAKLAQNLGGQARNLVTTSRFKRIFPSVKMAKDSAAKGKWNTNHGGSFTAAGIQGGITGEGAHVLILDDFYKNWKEAWSKTRRETVEEEFKATAYTRLAPGAAILILCTQWHNAGLDTFVLKHAKENPEDPQWEVIDIPAIMEEGYTRHPADTRKVGESYWPERWPVKALMATMRMVGKYIWNALFQQRASAEAGGIVLKEWIKYWSKLPERFDDMVISCDLAFKGKEENDNVAMQVWGHLRVKVNLPDRKTGYEDRYYLVDRVSRQMEFVESVTVFDMLCKRYPKAKQLVEDKANGPALQSVLQKRYPNIIMVPVDTDKPGRFRAVAPIFERGSVYLPDPKVLAWSSEVVEEYVNFTNVEHDDNVDATSQGLGHWEIPADGVLKYIPWEF